MKTLIHTIKKFFGIKLNMEEIQSSIKKEILTTTPAVDVCFVVIKSPRDINEMFHIGISCHFYEETVKLLDLLNQGNVYQVLDKEKVRIISRATASQIIHIACPYFFNNQIFSSIGVGLLLNYPGQNNNYPVRLYGTRIQLDEIRSKTIKEAKELFPYFESEGSQIENLFPRYSTSKRLSVDCCDTAE